MPRLDPPARPTPRLAAPLLAALLALLLAGPARAEWQEFTASGDELLVGNLIGFVEVLPADGGNFRIEAEIKGKDAGEASIRFFEEDGEFLVLFPVEEHDRYSYPSLGRGRTQIRLDERGRARDSNWWSRLRSLGANDIEVRGDGRGLQVWVDLRVHVPAGKRLLLEHGVGEVEASGLRAESGIKVLSGSVLARDCSGGLLVDTGSGHVELGDISGALSVDTGSGHVELEGYEGDELVIDTGSGHVEIARAKARKVHVDTGSGSVKLDEVECEELEVDTGSGGVEARRLAADDLEVDTGSGSVRLELVRMGDGDYVIDTGSGGITLYVPEGASAEFEADTGSGGVHIDVAGAEIHHKKRDRARFTIGDGAAHVTLDTGSGSVRVASR